ncbi:MAG: hypothetical protein HQM01_10095 [Magnetococcales bacterium]|nr:hypothetical protein [Magnetococcales bacterium]
MSKILGDLTLPGSMQWSDQDQWSSVSIGVVRTLDGNMVISSRRLQGGRPVTLVAQRGVTWLTRSHVDALLDMASQSGAIFPLAWGDSVMRVMFRHHEPPAVACAPLWPNSPHYTGEIKLMEV